VGPDTANPPKILIISSVPATLWYFYRRLPEKLKDSGFILDICSSPGKELAYFQKQFGLNVYPVNIHRKITPLSDIISIIKLLRLFRKNKYDIVHAHTPKAGLLGMIAAALAKVKCRIYTCHGLPSETETGIKRRLLESTEKISCSLAHQVLVVSKSLSEKMIDLGLCSPSKIKILGNGSACGVDLNRFNRTAELTEKSKSIRSKLSISPDDTVIGFVGRLVPDKGIAVLVESFARLYDTNKNCTLLVIGDYEPHRGKLSDKTVETINNHPAIKQCIYTNQIEWYYAAMDFLVLPTRREGFPYTILEAAAMSLPTIATKVTGCVDAVADGQTGLLVEPDNPEQLYEAILKLVKDPQLRQRLGWQGRKRAEALFDSKLLVDKHISLYRELLELQNRKK
jgi:glycosyltransferase involved in cell wall biosynthesis